jgi:predicted glycosyltransferase
MKIFIDMGHPAHVHVFKHFIWEMKKQGHQIKVTARDKDVTLQLLDAYHISFDCVGTMKKGKINLLLEWIYRDLKILIIARKFQPDILIGVLNPAIAHAAKIVGKKCIIFTDSEPEAIKYPLLDLITIPFADVILTLSSVCHDYGKKEVRVNSYKELAYLHPRWFTPNPSILARLHLMDGEDFVLLRFIAWGSYHDVDRQGFDTKTKQELIKRIEPYARVFISSESPLPAEFERYYLPIPPEQIHDFLSCAKLLISESQTMTTEAAVLGTPAIRFNSFVGDRDMGNFRELEEKYKLIFNFKDADQMIEKAVELIKRPDLKLIWAERREKLLDEKTELTSVMMKLVHG